MRGYAALAVLLLSSAVAGCASATPPSAEIPRVVSQAYDEPVIVGWALAYRQSLDGPLPFDLETRTRTEGVRLVGTGEAALLVTSGDAPEGWFATPLGRVGIAVIVHPDNPVRDLNLDELRDLLTGRVSSWQAVGGGEFAVEPSLPLPGEPFGDYVRRAVLGTVRPWPGTYLPPTPADAVELVAERPGAFAFVPFAAVTDAVAVLRLEGLLPAEEAVHGGRYPLVVELLATAPIEPLPPLREFLVWVQARLPAE